MFLRHLRVISQHANYGAIGEEADLFDAYISCSEHDKPWVLQNLLPGIDKVQLDDDNPFGGDFRLYYDDRDSEPGEQYFLDRI